MWHVYIVSCSDNSLYTGITTDISRRMKEHNSGKGGHCTMARLPVKCLYKEAYPNRSLALKRESEIKSWTRSKKLALIKPLA
jgi:predicted GIY-YIG superfamily endonuclease